MQRAVVKKLQWHPTDANLLMVQGIQGENLVYLWSAEEGPRALAVAPEVRLTGKAEARWISTPQEKKQAKLLFGDASTSVIACPSGSDTEFSTATNNGVAANNDVGRAQHAAHQPSETSTPDDEDDSLFDILSGKKPGAGDAGYLLPGGRTGSDGGISGETTDVEDAGDAGIDAVAEKIELQDTFGWKRGVAMVGH